MTDNSNSTGTRRNSTSKVKKDNKNPLDSTKNSKKPAAIAAPAATDEAKVKKDNKNPLESTNDNSISIASLELENIIDSKKENKEKEQLSYFEKQVLKELKGIRKASKNILKTIKKINV